MTITANQRRAGPYNADGSTTSFAYTFRIEAATELTVSELSVDGLTTTVITTGFSVTGITDTGGGNVVFTTAPLSGKKIVIEGNTPKTQSFALLGDEWDRTAIEAAMDKLMKTQQEINTKLSRAFLFELFAAEYPTPPLIPAIVSASVNKVLTATDDSPRTVAWASQATAGALTVTTYIETLLDDATAAAAAVTLDVPTNTTFNTHTADQTAHSQFKMLAETISVDSVTDAAKVFTAFDLTSHTGSDIARFAILKCSIFVTDSLSTTGVGSLKIQVRKKGTTPTTPEEMRYDWDATQATQDSHTVERTVFVECDSGEEFDYTFVETGTIAADGHTFVIRLVGYIT